jgi:hypothetical protein
MNEMRRVNNKFLRQRRIAALQEAYDIRGFNRSL